MPRLFSICLVFFVFVCVCGASAQEPEAADLDVVRAGGIEFHFATANQGRRSLARPDTYVDQMSPFDRQVRMRTDRDPGVDAYLDFVAGEVRDWPAENRAAVRHAFGLLDEPLRRIGLPKIGPVMLVHTTGREEGGAPYTRGLAIVLPGRQTGTIAKPRHKLISHELFHVLTRAHPILRDNLYSVIGFRHVGQIPLPPTLSERSITNPDAPVIEHVIDLKISERASVTVAPLLFSASTFDPSSKRSMFGYMKFQLMEVRSNDGKGWKPTIVDDKPVLHDAAIPDFHRQIGANTRYIIHPEEILADNFASLVAGAAVKDQWVIDAMRKTLATYDQAIE
jgi:hypothetical protein